MFDVSSAAAAHCKVKEVGEMFDAVMRPLPPATGADVSLPGASEANALGDGDIDAEGDTLEDGEASGVGDRVELTEGETEGAVVTAVADGSALPEERDGDAEAVPLSVVMVRWEDFSTS